MNTDTAPHTNLGLERTVLGHIIAFRAYAAYVSAGLRREDFFRRAHQLVFDAIARVDAEGAPADVTSIGVDLRRRGHLEEVGLVYYSSLVDDVLPPAPETVERLTRELAELAVRRELTAAVPKESLEDLASRLDRALHRGAEERRTYDSAAQLETIRQDIQRDQTGRIWLGFPTLDNMLEGLRPGEVFGLMARPGIGKTMVLGHVARAVADSDFGHAFFSLEMPAAQIVQRLACAHYGLNRYALRDRLQGGGLDPAEVH